MRGGENSLRKMDADEIKRRSWTISMNKESNEWLDGKLFFDILNQKDVFTKEEA